MKLYNSWLFLTLSALTATETIAQNAGRDEQETVRDSFDNKAKIAGYEPLSVVTDMLNIDLDQEAMEELLNDGTDASLISARKYYTQGAHSKSIASLALSLPHPTGMSAGAPLKGENNYNNEITGVVYLDVPAGAEEILFQYSVTDETPDRVCQVGARPVGDQIVSGCLRREGTVETASGDVLAYEYDPYVNNNNGRTLQGFSMMARKNLYECKNCPYPDFLKFREYYGASNYADQWITAAFDGEKTNFVNGNADFDLINLVGRNEAIKKGVSYMTIWMEVIGKMEASLGNCQTGCPDNAVCNALAVHEWDEAVALYTGSLAGEDGSGGGLFPYALADKRCANFHTCGKNRNNDVGESAVNVEIFDLFRRGQLDIHNGVCKPAKDHKERIVELMTIPLIQGTLKYAYITDRQESEDKERAEGAVFAASVLPMVHSCDKGSAQIIWENMAVGSGEIDFNTVHKAFAKTYKCLGITCADVGGLFDERTREYFDDAHPCEDGSGKLHPGIIIGIVVVAILLVSLVTCCCLPLRRRKVVRKGVDMPPAPVPEFAKDTPAAEEEDDENMETVTLAKSFNLV